MQYHEKCHTYILIFVIHVICVVISIHYSIKESLKVLFVIFYRERSMVKVTKIILILFCMRFACISPSPQVSELITITVPSSGNGMLDRKVWPRRSRRGLLSFNPAASLQLKYAVIKPVISFCSVSCLQPGNQSARNADS